MCQSHGGCFLHSYGFDTSRLNCIYQNNNFTPTYHAFFYFHKRVFFPSLHHSTLYNFFHSPSQLLINKDLTKTYHNFGVTLVERNFGRHEDWVRVVNSEFCAWGGAVVDGEKFGVKVRIPWFVEQGHQAVIATQQVRVGCCRGQKNEKKKKNEHRCKT